MGDYRVSDAAAADLAELADGMTQRGASLGNADRFVDELLRVFQNLADFPDLGTPRSHLPVGVLALPHRNHLVFYRKTVEGIEISRVLYGRMDLQNFFAEG